MYTFGSANPRSYSRGKRGIGGTMVFAVFDRDALIDAAKENWANGTNRFQRIGGELNMQPLSMDEWDKQMTGIASAGVTTTASMDTAIDITNRVAIAAEPRYDDEVPPFDITISLANEYGQKATVQIYSVEILNESNGFSMDTVQSQKACTFVAREVQYMRPVTA